ncbi:Signal transduction histidine kinase [Arboricoccus pini]|uniref:histidine kinase n=1 Tax=Arboricoccus pini TaxID=1963835 RepID=A0A212RN24_9PROT|nr:HAMP domain-containing sensor histidine kinase [Arboricoccus pini]SNB73885.1 Signal transduction histidine kinase [Arboricoccus pini]
MTTEGDPASELARALAYYKQECDALGARLLRMQEEQSQYYREARRSQVVAKLVREANQIADRTPEAEQIGYQVLEIVVENTSCDGAAILVEDPIDSRGFKICDMLGMNHHADTSLSLSTVPAFCFTSSREPPNSAAQELMRFLEFPFLLWAYDRTTGYAMVITNHSEANVNRAFEARDRMLIEGALSIYLDVVARKQAHSKVREAMRLAEQANLTKEAFLATLSHELRTPLNAILGLADIMSGKTQRGLSLEDCQSYAAEIGQSGRHLLRLINDILDYSSIGQGKLTLQPEWMRLSQGVGAAVRAAQGVASQRDVALAAGHIDPGIGVFVDTVRFRQIMDNLIGNAIKFTPSGGSVRVELRQPAEGGLHIEVIDTGIGMSPDDIEIALAAFGQVDSALSRRSSGTGLGLPITVGLIEAHGGHLVVQSESGQGSTLRVVLPANRVRLPEATLDPAD